MRFRPLRADVSALVIDLLIEEVYGTCAMLSCSV